MKTLVAYDSLYGNTKTIAQTIGNAIPGEVEVLHVGEVNASSSTAYDLLIVGAPTHGAKPSPAVQTFLDQIPERALEGKNVAGFDTRMTNRLITLFRTAAPKIAKALEQKGGNVVGPPGDFYVTCMGGRTVRLGRLLGLGHTFTQAREIMAEQTLEAAMIIRVMGQAIPKLTARGILAPEDLPLLRALADFVVHDRPIDLPLDAFFANAAIPLWHQPATT